MITVHIGLGLGVPVNEKRIVDVDINRSNVMANPLTYFERLVMIREVLLEAGMAQEEMTITPFPVTMPELYKYYLPLDGELMDGVKARLVRLAGNMRVHVLTADTFGHAGSRLEGVDCLFHLISMGDQALAKAEYVKGLGAQNCVSVGNGRNDALMLEASALGIGLIQEEGGAVSALTSADIICVNINHALDLLLFPLRLTVTMRS